MDLVQIKTPTYLTGYAESRIGGRSENQDSYGYCQTPFGFLVTVCDGMGGGPGGKTASTIAVQEIIQGVCEGKEEEEPTNIIIKAVRRANMAIISAGAENPALKGMGSTCTVLLITEECAYIAHVGDSRVYQFRGHAKVFRTFDHSMVFGLVKQKVITEEQARLSEQSNIITRALGIKPDVEVDITIRPYLAGDRFLLCTDGIHGAVPEEELIKTATSRKHALGALADEIATTIDGKGRAEGGGHDNLTLALLETKINSKQKDKMGKTVKILLAVLAVVCLLSIVGNILQCTSGKNTPQAPAEQAPAVQDSMLKETCASLKDSLDKNLLTISHLNDSISNQADSIKLYKENCGKLKKENEKIQEEVEKAKQTASNPSSKPKR